MDAPWGEPGTCGRNRRRASGLRPCHRARGCTQSLTLAACRLPHRSSLLPLTIACYSRLLAPRRSPPVVAARRAVRRRPPPLVAIAGRCSRSWLLTVAPSHTPLAAARGCSLLAATYESPFIVTAIVRRRCRSPTARHRSGHSQLMAARGSRGHSRLLAAAHCSRLLTARGHSWLAAARRRSTPLLLAARRRSMPLLLAPRSCRHRLGRGASQISGACFLGPVVACHFSALAGSCPV